MPSYSCYLCHNSNNQKHGKALQSNIRKQVPIGWNLQRLEHQPEAACFLGSPMSISVLRIQNLLIQIRLFTLIRIQILLFNLIWIRI
jgi:hypothetical protein